MPRALRPRPTSAKRTAPPAGPARTVYFAGELFSAKHLLGNACLAEAIHAASSGRYLCRLPQDFELRSHHPQAIRDKDLLSLLECDLALFNFDGPELDSGTVVEFMFAKFADIPCVILRSDFRSAGDQGPGHDPWNLMASFYPRSISVPVHSMTLYKKASARRAGQQSSAIAQTVCEQIAALAVRGLDRAAKLPPALPAHLREAVYAWLALMPGLSGDPKKLQKTFQSLLQNKVKTALL
ncbi:MAG: hypothetical protein RL376_603 [Verrucomicrobiota bacterium]